MSAATLLIIQGMDQGARLEIGDEPVSLGRGMRNTFRILDTEVSRAHAQVEARENRYWLTDLNSSNGTFVNGRSVTRHLLIPGDRIQLGRTIILFSAGDSSEKVESLADKIDLLVPQDPSDRSSIVAHFSGSGGQEILDRSSSSIAEERQQSLANLQALYRISEEVVRPSVALPELLQRILNVTIEVVGADRGCMLVSDPQTTELKPLVVSHRMGVDVTSRMPISRTIVDYVIKAEQAVRTTDAQHDGRFEDGQSIFKAGIREALCVPLYGHFQLLGVIYVDITTPAQSAVVGEAENHFQEDQLRLLAAIGRQSALAIENHRYQEALVKAERFSTMGQTIAFLSHHIKNILQGIRGGGYMIEMGLKQHQEETVLKGWRILDKNQERIYQLVMDMLTFSKEREPAYELADLNPTVNDVCELMETRAQEYGVSLIVRLGERIPRSMFDPEGIHRAVLNIVTNAIDALDGEENGKVVVETGFQPESESLYVNVRDNGPGIEDEQLKRLFNIFESSKGLRGTGIGLAVSQKILREHGGDIAVQSQLGRGTQFTLHWPYTREDHRANDSVTREM